MKIRLLTAVSVVAVVLASASSVSSAENGWGRGGMAPKMLGKGRVFDRAELPTRLRKRFDALSARQKTRARDWLQRFQFPDSEDDALTFDGDGAVLYVDPFKPELVADEGGDPAEGALPEAGDLSVSLGAAEDAFHLHSRPGAPNVVYLDFDGHTITGTAWNASAGVDPFMAKPFDLDGVPGSFSDSERAAIAEIWHRVSEDYAPFDIDVTTEAPSSFGSRTGRVLVTSKTDANGRAMPYNTAGGVAYVGVWGYSTYASYYSPALIYFDNLAKGTTYIAEACAHELGHNLGLSHDGTSSVTYYAGHGSGDTSWAPIMGNSYYNNVTQWSKGEYPDANNTQDDVAIIASKLDLREDDHGDAPADATPLAVEQGTGEVLVTTPETDPSDLAWQNKGVISTQDDVDVFRLTAGAGAVSLEILPAWAAFERTSKRGANLDVRAVLLDANGNEIASSDPAAATEASIATNVPGGVYYLEISGVASANYSDYAAEGQYFIGGALVPPTETPETPPTATFDTACAGATCDFADTSTASDGTILSRAWTFGDGGESSVKTPSHTYTANGTYTVTLVVTDDAGLSGEASAAVDINGIAPPNLPPEADFSYSCTDLVCSFADASSDDDGSVVEWSWSFGDGTTSSSQGPTHTFSEAGTYGVSLTVTDDAGETSSLSRQVSVTAPPDVATIDLTVQGRSSRRYQLADLRWSGASGRRVDVFRDGAKVARTANDGAYTDILRTSGGGSVDYQVCESGTSTCSSVVSFAF